MRGLRQMYSLLGVVRHVHESFPTTAVVKYILVQ